MQSLAEIVSKVNAKYSSYEAPGFTFRPSNLTEAELEAIEHQLGTRLPAPFREFLLSFNPGDLTLGWVIFGTGETVKEYLLSRNLNPEYPWWGAGPRPAHLLLIAGTDGDDVLLSVATGEVLTFATGSSWKRAAVVAADFDLFLRAVGQLSMEDDRAVSSDLRRRILSEISVDPGSPGSSRFWRLGA